MDNASLYARLETAFSRAAGSTAFETSSGVRMTYGEVLSDVSRMSNALQDLGVEPGDRVMVQVHKSIANVALYLATLKIGAVFNPLNTAYTAAELDYFISDAEPKLLVVDPGLAPERIAIAEARGVPHCLTLAADGTGSLRDKVEAAPADVRPTVVRADDDLAALLYTSGTTGRSKGAMITHRNLVSNAETLVEVWQFKGGDTLLHALPVFHVHGLFVALNTAFLTATKIIWLDKFDVAEVMAQLPAATVMMGVPTFYTRLLAEPSFGRAQTINIRLFIAGSAPLLAETHDTFAEKTGHRILERYGMTEAGMITSNPYKMSARIAGSVGYALPGVSVRIQDPDGVAVAPGDVGVLEVRGPNVFSGYWRMPEKTAEEFRDDGYFISGDMATIDEDGRVTIVGRAKDLIITGGYNVYPKEIEQELNDLDGVAESAVIGVPHSDFGEAVVAVVTPEADTASLDTDAVLSQLAGRLAKFKLPKRIVVAEDLPRNAMGKVQKNVLRDTLKDVLQT
ncbi:MAG: malonyl-CoA synthase [Pseudomonadota bacterium]